MVPAVVIENFFSDYASRWYDIEPFWGLTVNTCRQSNGEPFHADLTALKVPPNLHPGPLPEQELKRRRIDKGPCPPTS